MTTPIATPVTDPRCEPPTALPTALPDTESLGTGDDRLLRVLVLGVLTCGLVGLAAAGLLPNEWAFVGLAGVVGAGSLAYGWVDERGQTVRKVVSFVLLVGVAVVTLVRPSFGVDNLPETLALTLLGLCLAHTLVHDKERDLVVGLLVGGLMLVLAAGTAPGWAIALPLLMGWSAALGCVIVLHRNAQLRAAHVAAPAPRTARAPRHVGTVIRAVAAVAITGALLLLLVPLPDGAGLRSRLALSDAPDTPGDGGDALGSRSPGSYSSGALDLRVRGPLSDDPIVYVREGSPLLWRGTVYDTYADGTWYATPEGGNGDFQEVPQGQVLTPPPGEGSTSTEAAGTYGAVVTSRWDRVLVAPGRPVRLRASGPVLAGAGFMVLASDPAPLAAGDEVEGLGPNPYIIETAQIPDVHELPRPGEQSVGDVAPAAVWTSLPAEVPERVRDLGTLLVSGAASPLDAVRDVESYVRTSADYTLESPVTPSGEDVVDDFLFVSRLGFCEHFASAEAVLLRAGGVPARVVTGYAGVPSDQPWRAMRAKDLHAWVEAWLPGYGWVTSDPTAGAALAEPQASWHRGTWDRFQEILDSAIGRAWLAMALVVVVLLGWALLVLRRRYVRRGGPGRHDMTPEPSDEPHPLPAFRRLESALVGARVGRAPAETVDELAQRITTPTSDRSAFVAVDDAAYAPGPLPHGVASQAAASLDALTDQVRRRTAESSSRRRVNRPWNRRGTKPRATSEATLPDPEPDR
jgi:protein-glutamine gamma-glutamyltransferase